VVRRRRGVKVTDDEFPKVDLGLLRMQTPIGNLPPELVDGLPAEIG